jgi:hypothetical protein
MTTQHRAARDPERRRSPIRFRCRRNIAAILALCFLLPAGACVRQETADFSPDHADSADRLERKLDIVDAVRSNIGIPYRFGGNSPATGFDCSGLVCWSYQQVGIQLPRSSRDLLMFGIKVDKQQDLKPGDIVVFKGTRGRTGWHSGIYTGDGKFVHSPTSGKNVMESSMDENYYARRYVGARRIPRDGSAAEMYAAYEARRKAQAPAAKDAKKSKKKERLAAANTRAKSKGGAGEKTHAAAFAGKGAVQAARGGSEKKATTKGKGKKAG